MLTKLTKKQSGFTLIELMIVIAIIGILAAIAVPQFLAFRMRSYNAAAKAVVHNIKADEANLNAELGVYGHTELNNQALNAVDSGYAPADTTVDVLLVVAATPTGNGARLVGTRTDASAMVFAVGTALGPQMIADVADINNANNESTFHAFARHFKGDSAYGLDGDIENRMYSVSDSTNWPNNPTLMATPVAPVLNAGDDINGANGGGLPSPNWAPVQ